MFRKRKITFGESEETKVFLPLKGGIGVCTFVRKAKECGIHTFLLHVPHFQENFCYSLQALF